MADAFPIPIADVISTLAELFRHKGNTAVVELLENANAEADLINFDNWDGGTYTWALRLAVPVSLFAHAEVGLPNLEKELLAKLSYISRTNPNHSLSEVTIAPIAPGAATIGARLRPSERQVRRLWPAKRFRLFVSHVSAHRVAVGQLKEALASRGITAFVAHDDIEPSLEWQAEIELSLRSMHALAAVLTPDFHASNWTDHELGWALGRGLMVFPVIYGAVPYGLAGKFQGVPGDFRSPGKTADGILRALLANEQTHPEMRRCLVPAFCDSTSYVMSLALSKVLLKLGDVTAEESAMIRQACVENKNIVDAYTVPAAMFEKFGKPPEPAAAASLDEDAGDASFSEFPQNFPECHSGEDQRAIAVGVGQ